MILTFYLANDFEKVGVNLIWVSADLVLGFM